MFPKRLILCLLASVFPFCFSARLLADSVITVNVPGADSTYIQGINNSGQVVGSFVASIATCNSCDVGFVQNADGTYTSFVVPGSFATNATAINDADTTVGYYYNGPNGATSTQGFIDLGGQFTTVSIPNSYQTVIYGINNNGQTVGEFLEVGTSDAFGFVRNVDGTITQIQVPGASNTAAVGINNVGQTVGFFDNGSGKSLGFLLNPDGSFTTLDAPGSTDFTQAFGINDSGQIVGIFDNSTGEFGFLYSGGTYTEFALPSCVQLIAGGINNEGQISGDCGGNPYSGFITTETDFLPVPPPVTTPEPQTWSLLTTGLIGLFAVRRNKRFIGNWL